MIPAPIIWIIVPGGIALVLYILRRRERIILGIGIATALILAWMAWRLPIGDPIPYRLWSGFPSLRIDAQMILLGRSFVIENSTRPLLIFIYIGIGFWLGGAYSASVNRLFTPLGLLIGALLVAAIAVRPTLYAALLLNMVALVCVPLLSPPGKPIVKGVIRFLIFQTIGMGFILIGDWWIPSIEISDIDAVRTLQAAAILGMGFALLEAVFPFHTWVPMLSEHAHPFAFTFVLFILPMAIGLVSLKYINIFSQLSIAPGLYSSLRIVGAFLVIIGGVGAAFQNHLGRILGFAVITQIGLSMLTFSLRADRSFDPLFLGIFFAQLFPQGLGLAIWGLSLHIIHTDRGSLSFRKVQGTAQQLPFASSSLAISNLSLAGLPLLASFPVYVIIWSSLSVQAASIALLSLVGIAFLLIAAIRSIAVLVMNPEQQPWTISENRFQLILLSLGGLALLVVGLMPQIILPQLINMAFIYGNTGP